MGLGKLQIWIASENDPCKISERDDRDNLSWVVGIWHCDGSVLKWCSKSYFNMTAKCGFLEVTLPPGRYVVRAADSMYTRFVPGQTKFEGIWGNQWTDHAVVTVCCDSCECITLFAPTVHNCGWGFMVALSRMTELGLINSETGKNAVAAIKNVLKEITKSDWDKSAQSSMLRLLEEAGINKD